MDEPTLRKLLIAKDITEDGVVLRTAAVKVTAFRTPHPPITDNFAFRFETPDGDRVLHDTNCKPKPGIARGAEDAFARQPHHGRHEDWRGEASKTSRTRSACFGL